jgi:hypothetical protein
MKPNKTTAIYIRIAATDTKVASNWIKFDIVPPPSA